MKAITIRGIEPDVAEKLKRTALEQNKSLNQLVLEFIKKNIGMEKEKKYSRVYTDLDDLFGTWDDNEYHTIQNKINQERQIDQDLWK
ncbi:MAG: antitoxin [Proteobacteria bacterium]|nr:antitoxin [Pseudomonadota bacterium]MBU1585960.1 antitoxin [Pseudomonadota bacterium]MBU2628232.1 antitoxin [Pseudomonadota bacterium]